MSALRSECHRCSRLLVIRDGGPLGIVDAPTVARRLGLPADRVGFLSLPPDPDLDLVVRLLHAA